MYSRLQDEFARGFAVFLLLLLGSGALICALVYITPASLLAPVTPSLAAVFFAVWPMLCCFGAIGLRNNPRVKRWLWTSEE